MTNEGDGWYTYTLKNATSANVIFDYNGKQTADLSRTTGEWWFYNGEWYSSNPLEADNDTVTIYYKNSWSKTYIHYKVGSGSWTAAPGVRMDDVTSSYAKITIDLDGASGVTACFNNGSNTWDNNNSKDYSLSAGTYTISNKKITSGAPAGL